MPTIVGILIFIIVINTTSERLKARNFFICRYFRFYEQLKFRARLSWAWTKFYSFGARLGAVHMIKDCNVIYKIHVTILIHMVTKLNKTLRTTQKTRTKHILILSDTHTLSSGTASAYSVELDLGCTSSIYFDNVTLTLHNVTLTSQKPCQS